MSVYRLGDEYLRTGGRAEISKELEYHRRFQSIGVPVPQILQVELDDDPPFYTETSVGQRSLAKVFADEWKANQEVSSGSFDKMVELLSRFAEAQLKSAGETNELDFRSGIEIEALKTERPEIGDSLDRAFDKICERTARFPVVLTHGDLNPYNFFDTAIIDFETVFSAPAGYDIITACFHTYNFPIGLGFELTRRHEFTQEQIRAFVGKIDKIYTAREVPALSTVIDDFIVARAIWAAAHLTHLPILRQWRYARVLKILADYLAGKSILKTVTKFRL